MRNATRQAQQALLVQLHSYEMNVTASHARELFVVCNFAAQTKQFERALTNVHASLEAKHKLIKTFFPHLSEIVQSLVQEVAAHSWSDSRDAIDIIEELGVRILAVCDSEELLLKDLFAFSRVIVTHSTFELALLNKFASIQARKTFITDVLGSKISKNACVLVAQIGSSARHRNPRAALMRAIDLVAAQYGKQVARITVVADLTLEQHSLLVAVLSKKYSRPIAPHIVINKNIVGGVRIQVGNDVIDDSIASRIKNIRLQLAS